MNSIAGVVSAISYRGDRHHFLVTAEGHDRSISVSQQNDGDTKSMPMDVGAEGLDHLAGLDRPRTQPLIAMQQVTAEAALRRSSPRSKPIWQGLKGPGIPRS